MTISADYAPNIDLGNGTTRAFAVTFPFADPLDIDVTIFDIGAGADVMPPPALNGGLAYDYTVTGVIDPAGTGVYPNGTVTFNTAPPGNTKVIRCRSTPERQEVVLIDNARFPAKAVEGGLDHLELQIQEIESRVSRAIVAPVSDGPVDMTLPPAAERADTVLTFDDAGNIENPGIASGPLEAAIAIFLAGAYGPAPTTSGWARTLATALVLYAAPVVLADGQPMVVDCRSAPNDGYGGTFVYKAGDAATVFPQSGLGFVDAAGRRFFRQYTGPASVHWFGALGDGVTNDRTAMAAALAASRWVCGSPGAVYHLGPVASEDAIFPLTGIDSRGFLFNGAKIVVQTTGRFSAGLFVLDNMTGFTLVDPWIEDLGFDQSFSNPWQGIAVIRFNPVTGEVRDTTVRNARYKGVVAAFDSTSAAHRVRGIWFTGDIKDSYYGIALSNNGDDLFADYRTDNLVRSYFVYGVNNHEFVLYSYNHAPSNADCLIKSKDPAFPTTNIRGRFVSIASTVPAGEQLAFESQNDSGDAVIRDCWIDYNDVQSPGLNFSIGFRHYNNASVLQANDPNTKTDIHIRGFASKGILHDSAATAPQRQTFNGMGVYTVAMLPPPTRLGETVYVTNENGGGTLAFTAGTATPGEGIWLRVQDRAVVS